MLGVSYSDFEEQSLNSYYQSETISNNRYVLYYYDSSDEASKEIQKEILKFFKDFELLDFYLLDTSTLELEVSNFGLYSEPVIYIISSNRVYEEYKGITAISEFIVEYSNIEFDYDLFEAQHISSYEEILAIENESYILYYYLDSCPHCIASKPYMLPWAFTKSAEDIYFMEGSTVPNADQKPTELIILNSGTPILVLMSNGKFANEFYSGKKDVLNYIDEVGDGDIIAKELLLDYDEFDEFSIDYFDTLTISDNLHFEYFYSPYCSHCEAIKQELLLFLDGLVNIDFYLIDTSTADGVSKISSFRGTPSLFIVNDNEVVAEYVGSLDIPNFIENYINGEIDLSIYE
ncbi:thioredoxin family protein [Candidatus Izimaplasma bacterium HR1]|uniref:thioredoxin family protein n=1 Tax=Candidatus Izimoplasma sp. HR1 TaxID=1541959 RepID=UPI00130DD5EA